MRLTAFGEWQFSDRAACGEAPHNVTTADAAGGQSTQSERLELFRYAVYHLPMIRSFRCRDTEALANDHPVRRFAAIERVARRKLEMLAVAARLDDLKVPPGNRLEPLKGNRRGQYSIRINDQWRLCFRWTDGAEDVEIADYH